ncbi:hypothetical protein TNCV_3842691 [Trichonephila clavipes]|nr:hypothetical protein TNCV_3842691 [Trichonephila clavipes]
MRLSFQPRASAAPAREDFQVLCFLASRPQTAILTVRRPDSGNFHGDQRMNLETYKKTEQTRTISTNI